MSVLAAAEALDVAAEQATEALYEAQDELRLALRLHVLDVSDAVYSHLEGAREHADRAIDRATRLRQEIRWARRVWDAEDEAKQAAKEKA